MDATHSPTGFTGQPLIALLRDAAAALDKIEGERRTSLDELDAQRMALRTARREYFSIARAIQNKRKAPRLPAGIGNDARAVVQAALDAARKSAALYKSLCELTDDLASYRDISDAAAQSERDEAIFSELRDAFNARVHKEWERGTTAQARAFDQQIQAATRATRRAMLVGQE